MYASYLYSAGATAANILADVVAILTGETTVANLSASCDKVNTAIDATATVAGWTSHDASAGTNAVCLKAAVPDNAAQFEYVVIDTNSVGYIYAKVYEGWNAGAHTGTNMAYLSATASSAQRVNVAAGGRLEISASAYHIMIHSFQNGVHGSSGNTGACGCLARTRLSLCDTVAKGYPPFAFVQLGGFTTTNPAYSPRHPSANGTDLVTTGASLSMMYPFGNSSSSIATPPESSIPIDDTMATFGHMLLPFGVNKAAEGFMGGEFSSLCDIWVTTYKNGSFLDTLVFDSKTYVIWPALTNWRFAVRKG